MSAGLAAGDIVLSSPLVPETTDGSVNGFIGGVHVGYDWQFDNKFVIGAVADISASNIGADNLAGFPFEPNLDYLGTVRARAGYAWDRALFYVHGGFAYGKLKLSTPMFDYSLSENYTGWTIGAGLEYALTDKVTFGTEYAYVDLGKKNFDSELYFEPKFHTIKATLSYRF